MELYPPLGAFKKYKKLCARCNHFFLLERSTPSSRIYCDDCRKVMRGL